MPLTAVQTMVAQDTRNQNHQGGLSRRFFRGLQISRAAGFGNQRQETHAQSGKGAAYQPCYGAGGPHGGGGLGAQGAYHGSVNVLDCRLHDLFDDGGPGQSHDSCGSRPGGLLSLFTVHLIFHLRKNLL